MAEKAKQGAAMGCFWAAAPIIIVFAAAPLLSVWISLSIAEGAGCRVHEGAANSCIVLGGEMGPTLYAMFVAGWFSFVTLPLGGLALLIWAGVGLFLWLRRGAGRTQEPSG